MDYNRMDPEKHVFCILFLSKCLKTAKGHKTKYTLPFKTHSLKPMSNNIH